MKTGFSKQTVGFSKTASSYTNRLVATFWDSVMMPVLVSVSQVATLVLLGLSLHHIEAFQLRTSLRSPLAPCIHTGKALARKSQPCMRHGQGPTLGCAGLQLQLEGSGAAVAETIMDGGRTTNTMIRLAGRSAVRKFDQAGSFVPDPSKTDARIALLVVAALSGSGYGAVKLLDGSLDSPSILAIRFVVRVYVHRFGCMQVVCFTTPNWPTSISALWPTPCISSAVHLYPCSHFPAPRLPPLLLPRG